MTEQEQEDADLIDENDEAELMSQLFEHLESGEDESDDEDGSEDVEGDEDDDEDDDDEEDDDDIDDEEDEEDDDVQDRGLTFLGMGGRAWIRQLARHPKLSACTREPLLHPAVQLLNLSCAAVNGKHCMSQVTYSTPATGLQRCVKLQITVDFHVEAFCLYMLAYTIAASAHLLHTNMLIASAHTTALPIRAACINSSNYSQDDTKYSRSTGRPHVMNAANMLKRRESQLGCNGGFSSAQCCHLGSFHYLPSRATRVIDRMQSRVYIGNFSTEGNVFVGKLPPTPVPHPSIQLI